METVAAERRQGKVMGRATRLNRLKGTCGRWGGRGRAQAPVRDDHGGPGQACLAGGTHPHPWYCTPRDGMKSVGGPVWGGGEGTATALPRHARGCRTRPRRPAGPRSGTSQSRSLTSPWPTSPTPLTSTAWRVSVGTNCTPHTPAAGRPAPPPHGCPMCRPKRELVINCVEAGQGRVGCAPPAAVYATARGAGHRSGRRVSPAVLR